MTGSYRDDHLFKKKKRRKGAFRTALARLTGTCRAAECRGGGLRGNGAFV